MIRFTLGSLRIVRFVLFILPLAVSGQKEIDSLKKLLQTETDLDQRFTLMSEMVRYSVWTHPDSAIRYSEVYLQEAEKQKNQSEIARGYNFLGLCHQTNGDMEGAIGYYLKALPRYEVLKDSFMIAMMYNNIGAAYQYREKYDETIRYYHIALDIFTAIHNREWEATVQYNIAVQLNKIGQYEKALQLNFDSEKLFAEIGNKLYQGYSQIGIGSSLQELKQYNEAIKHYEMAIELINPAEDQLVFATLYTNLCACFTHLEKFDQAKQFCDKANEVATEIGAVKELKEVHHSYYEFYKTSGNLSRAIYHLEQYHVFRDSLFNEEKDSQITDMLAKYESEKKQQEIEITQLKLQEQTSSKRIVAAGAGLTGLFLLGALLMLRLRSRNNRQLAAKNEEIERALGEKEILLREIHHRVKNNLQVVSSLLSIQSRGISDEKAQEAITESRNRVRSMALIHQNLYNEGNLMGIDISDYIEKLGASLFSTYQVDNDSIELEFDVQPMVLDVDTTIPLGLILNELITNALKYAFSGKTEECKILVMLHEKNGELVLAVSDNGIGISETQHGKDSFGIKMIQSFAQKLDATWGIDTNEALGSGTRVTLRIKKYKKQDER